MAPPMGACGRKAPAVQQRRRPSSAAEAPPRPRRLPSLAAAAAPEQRQRPRSASEVALLRSKSVYLHPSRPGSARRQAPRAQQTRSPLEQAQQLLTVDSEGATQRFNVQRGLVHAAEKRAALPGGKNHAALPSLPELLKAVMSEFDIKLTPKPRKSDMALLKQKAAIQKASVSRVKSSETTDELMDRLEELALSTPKKKQLSYCSSAGATRNNEDEPERWQDGHEIQESPCSTESQRSDSLQDTSADSESEGADSVDASEHSDSFETPEATDMREGDVSGARPQSGRKYGRAVPVNEDQRQRYRSLTLSCCETDLSSKQRVPASPATSALPTLLAQSHAQASPESRNSCHHPHSKTCWQLPQGNTTTISPSSARHEHSATTCTLETAKWGSRPFVAVASSSLQHVSFKDDACGDWAFDEDAIELLAWGPAVIRDVFGQWNYACGNEVRISDLDELLADLGILADSKILHTTLSGMLYATLDWGEFASFLKDYRKLERQNILNAFAALKSRGDCSTTEESIALLEKLGFPACRQAAEWLERSKHEGRCQIDAFEHVLHVFRCTEGFRETDVNELRVFFDAEKTISSRREPHVAVISLERVWSVMMLRGFPTSHDEVHRIAADLFENHAHGVTFRQMLILIRCLRELERTQTVDMMAKYSTIGRNTIQVADLNLALGDLGYYPDHDAIVEHLQAVQNQESQDSLTLDGLVSFLREYRRVAGFTKSEFCKLQKHFSNADSTGRGKLNALELTKVLRQAGLRVSLVDCQHAMLQFDFDCKGLLSLDEVLKLVRMFHAREAELRRQVFLRFSLGHEKKRLPTKAVSEAIAAIRGRLPEPLMLQGLIKLGSPDKEGYDFSAFEHLCKLFWSCERQFIESHSGFAPEQVAELQIHFQRYARSGNGIVPCSQLREIILDVFPAYAYSPKQQQLAKRFVEQLQVKRSASLTFETFLDLVRLAEEDAEVNDFEEEDRLLEELGFSHQTLQIFREIFVNKAQHECALSCEAVFEILHFAIKDFDLDQSRRFQSLLIETDGHYGGVALRFPDFLRFMHRLTTPETEKCLGIDRAALRQLRRQMERRVPHNASPVAGRRLARSCTSTLLQSRARAVGQCRAAETNVEQGLPAFSGMQDMPQVSSHVAAVLSSRAAAADSTTAASDAGMVSLWQRVKYKLQPAT